MPAKSDEEQKDRVVYSINLEKIQIEAEADDYSELEETEAYVLWLQVNE